MINDFLRQYVNEPVHYIPNPGNAGDSIIASATYQVFDRIGLKYQTQRPNKFDPTNQVVIYGGGGNLVGENTFSAQALRRIHHRARRLILLPHTIKDVDELLRSFTSKTTIICREKVTYEYVSGMVSGPEVYLSDDMAFSLDPDALMKKKQTWGLARSLIGFLMAYVDGSPRPWSRSVAKRWLYPITKLSLETGHPKHQLNALRTDGDRTNAPLAGDNLDISQIFDFGVCPREIADFASAQLLGYLSDYERVVTNRLHVAISAALLGKQIELHSNGYYKCRAVYEYSMKSKFSNVTFVA
jgi:exopolysaccharide biosynthesis predicted pyruvyltransferase EpsI